MSDLHEYEITGPGGIVTTVQLTEDDAKKVPEAKRKAAPRVHQQAVMEGDEQEHAHSKVSNRARR